MLLRHLEYLVALDRERHFGRAAAACHVSQPALSAAIARFESELGVPLVRRGRRFEGLTPEGERVLVWARRTLDDAAGLEQEVGRLRGGLEGTLRLGAIPTSLSATAFISSRFRALHPRMRVEVRSMSSRDIASGLAAGELDAGLTYLDNEPLQDVDALPLWTEGYLLVRPARPSPLSRSSRVESGTHAVAHSTLDDSAEAVTWAQAAELQLCLLTGDMQHRRIVDAAFGAAGVAPQPVVETNSVPTLIAHAREGVPGITADTWLVTNPIGAGVRASRLVEPEVEHVIGLVARAGGLRSPVVAELMELFAPLELDARLRPESA